MAKGECPECGKPMEVRKHRVKKDGADETQDNVYVCHHCGGTFVPKSVFGVH